MAGSGSNLLAAKGGRIPNIVHFVYGFKEGEEEFLFSYHLAIVSAWRVNKPDTIYLHCPHPPNGDWWERCRELVTVVPTTPPTQLACPGSSPLPLAKFAHQADIVRLQVLLHYGGIYLDIDTISYQPWSALLGYSTVMGEEEGVGLCNAVIMAEKEAPFIRYWYDSYHLAFLPEGWNEASVKYPRMLSRLPSLSPHIHVVSSAVFFVPSWSDVEGIFQRTVSPSPELITLHLWESYSYRWLSRIDPAWLRNNRHSLYSKIALSSCPDFDQEGTSAEIREETSDAMNDAMNDAMSDAMSDAMRVAFQRVYLERGWDPHHPSGPGSHLSATGRDREILNEIIPELGIASLLDVGCGQYGWMEELVAKWNLDYLGVDIVEQAINENRERYPSRRFEAVDATRVCPGKADLLFCRTVTQHLSSDSTKRLLQLLLSSGSRYLLITSYNIARNGEALEWSSSLCHSLDQGAYRRQNLNLYPYYLPWPVRAYPLDLPSSPSCYLCLYSLAQETDTVPKPLGFRLQAWEVLYSRLQGSALYALETGTQRQSLSYDTVDKGIPSEHPFSRALGYKSVPHFASRNGSWSCWADGASTTLFDSYISRHGGSLHTLDLSHPPIPFSPAVVRVKGDSVASLRALSLPQCNVVLLDSFDWEPHLSHACAWHQLQEFIAVVNSNIAWDGYLLLDDNWIDPVTGREGKGKYLIEFLHQQGCHPIVEGYLSLYQINKDQIDKAALSRYAQKCDKLNPSLDIEGYAL